MSGWYKMERGWQDNPMFSQDKFSRRDAWIWLIDHACWKPTKYDVKGRTVMLERGQICIGRDRLARQFGWSESAVERFLTRLKTEHMIERETGQGKSVITICNYAKYQSDSDETGQESEQQFGQTSDRHRTAKEESKNIRKDITNVISNKRAREKPDLKPDFELPDWVPLVSWHGWIEMRKGMGKRPTVRAMALAINKLQELQRDGHDPGAVLDQSTLANWQGLFPVKDQNNGNNRNSSSKGGHPGGRQPEPDGFTKACREVIDRADRADFGEADDHGSGTGDAPRLALVAFNA